MQGRKLKNRAFLLVFFALVSPAIIESCSSPFFCKTLNVSYMSMTQLSQVYLNATAIKTATTSNMSSCRLLCLRHEGCFSININISRSNNYQCQLLAANLYSSPEMLVKSSDFIHLFLESPCKNYPCKHEGVCKPNYSNNTYSCECKINATSIASGKNRKTVISSFRTADYYWTFDKSEAQAFSASSGTGLIVAAYRFESNTLALHVPGRRTPVTYMKPDVSSILQITSSIPCLNEFSGCQQGVTYSVWIRLGRKELKQTTKIRNIFFSYNAGHNWGIHFYAKKGTRQGYVFSIIPNSSTRWTVAGFGKNVEALKWTHFMIIFSNKGELCAYINGEKSQCTSSSTPVSVTTEIRVFRLGYGWDSALRTEIYIDDFAVWKSVLSADDVKEVYKEGSK